jgi:ribosomal protein S18 acetylase RimI-like enzyme
MPAENTTYISGGFELLDQIQPLWEQLNQQHAAVSQYFADEFETNHFSERKAKLFKKYADGKLRVDLCQAPNILIGYLVSGITSDEVGEIESIFVAAGFRGQGVANELMNRALTWLDLQDVHTKVIAVAVGNERVYTFYERFGFYPRLVMLKQKDT